MAEEDMNMAGRGSKCKGCFDQGEIYFANQNSVGVNQFAGGLR